MMAMTPKFLKTRISKLRVAAPVTESYGKALTARGIWNGKLTGLYLLFKSDKD